MADDLPIVAGYGPVRVFKQKLAPPMGRGWILSPNQQYQNSPHDLCTIAICHPSSWHKESQEVVSLSKTLLMTFLFMQVMDLSGGSSRSFAPGLGKVVVSTVCVQDNLVAAGGFSGDLVIKNTSQQDPVCRCVGRLQCCRCCLLHG